MTLIANTSKFCTRIPDLNLIYSFLTQDEKLIFSKVCKLFHKFAKAEEYQGILKILSSGELPLFRSLLNRLNPLPAQAATFGVLDLKTGKTFRTLQTVDTQIEKDANDEELRISFTKNSISIKYWRTRGSIRFSDNQTVLAAQVNSDTVYCLLFDSSIDYLNNEAAYPYTFWIWNLKTNEEQNRHPSVFIGKQILSMQITSDEKYALFLCKDGEILILDLPMYTNNFTEHLKYDTTLYADLIPDGETSAAFNVGVKLYNIRKELETQQNSPEIAMGKIATLPPSISQIVNTKLDKIRANIDFSKVNPIAIPEIFETPPSSQEIIQAINQTIEHFKLAASLQKIDETRPHKSRTERKQD